MTVVATLYYPDVDPLTSTLVAPIVIPLLLLYLRKRKYRFRGNQAPIIMLIVSSYYHGGVLYPLVEGGRSFPDADDYVAGVICLAFSTGFALSNLRAAIPKGVWLDSTVLVLGVSVLAFEAMTRALIPRVYPGTWFDTFGPTLVATGIGVAGTVLAMYLASKKLGLIRHSVGLCVTCSYDLRANTSGVCPECGTPIEGEIPASATNGTGISSGTSTDP